MVFVSAYIVLHSFATVLNSLPPCLVSLPLNSSCFALYPPTAQRQRQNLALMEAHVARVRHVQQALFRRQFHHFPSVAAAGLAAANDGAARTHSALGADSGADSGGGGSGGEAAAGGAGAGLDEASAEGLNALLDQLCHEARDCHERMQ